MGSMGLLELSQIDFSLFDPENPACDEWDKARPRVMQALETFGAFEAVYDNRLTLEIRDAMFGKAMSELFVLPLETKMLNTYDKPQPGYIGPTTHPGVGYEMISIEDAKCPKATEAFARRMWLEGNPSFSQAVLSIVKPLAEVEQMVRRMVMQSLGIEKHYYEFSKQIESGLRLTKYPAPEGGEKIGLAIHTDTNLFSIICQHEVPGLEVVSKDGEWAAPSLNSITVLVGDMIVPWTNGRLRPCRHRAIIRGTEKRHIVHFGVYPKDEYMLKALDELVDEEHPLLYRPLVYGEYYRFRGSTEGEKALKLFCGARQDEVEA